MLKGIVTDIDGTITDRHRRIHTGAISALRELCDCGVEVVLASGNTSCFMDAVSRMIGTQGSFIAENGGVYRAGYTGDLRILGDQSVVREALGAITMFCQKEGIALDLYSPTYRFADQAFARTVHPGRIREIVQDFPVEIIDTGFAIHIQARGISKGHAFLSLTRDLGLNPADFLAVGDAENDIDLIKNAGIGVAVRNAPEVLAAAATWVSQKNYGEGFIEALTRYRPYFLDR